MKWIPEPKHGERLDLTHTMYPSDLTCYTGEEGPQKGINAGAEMSTSYLYVFKGVVSVITDDPSSMVLPAGFCVAIPGKYVLSLSGDTKVFVIRRYGYNGMFGMSKIEDKGRLAYIDGCSDTTLIHPNRLGDPCLNYLHFPPNINQTQHIHPSIRLGIVAGGAGVAWQDSNFTGKGWEKELKPGGMFCLEESEIHSFRTTDHPMEIIAYHPDSDTGPSDENHAMLNRTYIDWGKK